MKHNYQQFVTDRLKPLRIFSYFPTHYFTSFAHRSLVGFISLIHGDKITQLCKH